MEQFRSNCLKAYAWTACDAPIALSSLTLKTPVHWGDLGMELKMPALAARVAGLIRRQEVRFLCLTLNS
jgi:hypothetical protein